MGTSDVKGKVVDVTFQSAVVATGNGTTLRLDGASGVLAQVTGITTATITWEATLDGTNYVAVKATNLTSGTAATTATADGLYLLNASGATLVRARVSSWTDGTITVTGRSTSLPFSIA